MSTEIYKPVIIGIIIVLLLVAARLIWYYFSEDENTTNTTVNTISVEPFNNISGVWEFKDNVMLNPMMLTLTHDKITGVVSMSPRLNFNGITVHNNLVTIFMNSDANTIADNVSGVWDLADKIIFNIPGKLTTMTRINNPIQLIPSVPVVSGTVTSMSGNWTLMESGQANTTESQHDLRSINGLPMNIVHDTTNGTINIIDRGKINGANLFNGMFSIYFNDANNTASLVISGNWDLVNPITMKDPEGRIITLTRI